MTYEIYPITYYYEEVLFVCLLINLRISINKPKNLQNRLDLDWLYLSNKQEHALRGFGDLTH